MANRSRLVCKPRLSGKALTPDVEFSLCEWSGLRVLGMGVDDDYVAMEAAWESHKDNILPRFIAARPGDRPWAMWALGLIPLPPIVEVPPAYDVGYQTKAGLIHERAAYGGEEGIYHHLLDLGLITDQEKVQAEQRIDSDDRYDYKFISVQDHDPVLNYDD